MGQAKQKEVLHAAILREERGCVYCAGLNPAVELDHMPPRLLFRTSQRPKGLEFPSCRSCNVGTSRADVIAAYMARTFPGIQNKLDADEWERLLREVKRAVPGLLEEMHVSRVFQKPLLSAFGFRDHSDLAVLRADGPLLSAHMQAFAAKIGFALCYEFTGAFVPTNGRVQVRWFTSEEMLNRRVPESLYGAIGAPRILKQGKITSGGVFEYGFSVYERQPKVKLFFARLRDAVEIAAFAVESAADLPFPEGVLATFAPGDLQLPAFDRIRV